MKGIIELAVEIDYSDLLSNSDIESLMLYSGASSKEEVIESHIQNLAKDLSSVVDKLKYASCYYSAGVFEDELDNSVEEESSKESVDTFKTVESTTLDDEIESGDDEESEDSEESWDYHIDNVKSSFRETVWKLVESGSILEIYVASQFIDELTNEVDGIEDVDKDSIFAEAQEEPFIIVFDPLDEDGLQNVVGLNEDGEIQTVSY